MSRVRPRPMPAYDPLDPARRGTLVVTTAPGDTGASRCAKCGGLLEVLWEHVAGVLDGTHLPWCDECCGDQRATAIAHPAPDVVAERARARQARLTAAASDPFWHLRRAA